MEIMKQSITTKRNQTIKTAQLKYKLKLSTVRLRRPKVLQFCADLHNRKGQVAKWKIKSDSLHVIL